MHGVRGQIDFPWPSYYPKVNVYRREHIPGSASAAKKTGIGRPYPLSHIDFAFQFILRDR